MALVTDTLRTVLEVQGLNNYLSNLRQVQQGSLQAGLAHDDLQKKLTGLPRLLNQVTTSLGGTLGPWALLAVGAQFAAGAIQQVSQAMGAAMTTFDRYNDALTRATILFGNAGRGNQSGNLAGMARGRLFGLGIAEDRTLNLAGRMAELGYSPGTIDKLLPGLQDISTGTAGRISEDRALTMITRALLSSRTGSGIGGGGRGLQALGSRLGLDVRFLTGDINRDIRYLADQIHEKFGGVAEALANTASGMHQRNTELLTAATSRLGGLIEYGLLPAYQLTNFLLKGFIGAADRTLMPSGNSAVTNTGINAVLLAMELQGGLLGAAAGGIRASRNRATAAGDAAARARTHDSDALDQIAANTNRMASALGSAVFGNASSFSKQALAWNNFYRSVSLRG